MNDELLMKIEELAGAQRAATFRAAAEFILEHDCKAIVETGCYRGIPGDGQSTLILATLAAELNGSLTCFDISPDSISRAKALLAAAALPIGVAFYQMDSVLALSATLREFRFAYLDSFDHDANNPGPCQRHELAEVGAVLGKMKPPCAILLDDNVPETGGKTLLGSAFLKDRGWTLAAEGYQLLFVKLE